MNKTSSGLVFIRYLFAGWLAYVVEMGTLYGLHRGMGLSPVASVGISFWAGFIVAFLLQKIFAFQNYDKDTKTLFRQLLMYSALVAWNYGFTVGAVAALQYVAPVYVIRTLCILIIVSWNFIIYKRLFDINKKSKIPAEA